MKYIAQIRELLARLTNAVRPDEETRLWNAWLDLGNKKESRDLQSLLASDLRKEFKIRALVVLLAPDLRALPFRWDDTQHSLQNYLFLDWVNVKILPQELVRLAGELICQNIDYVLGEKEEKIMEALAKYNNLILQFLAMLPEDDELSTRLFSRYQINDPIAYWNMEDASGYAPLRNIFCSENVPTKWKLLADKQMQNRIVAEFGGREQPREDWEVALKCYIEHIQMSNYDGRVGYSRELLATQIRFITGLPGIEDYEKDLFSSWQIAHILEAIPGEDLRGTRHKLVRLTVLRKTKEHSGFSVWNPESRRAADLMLREFGTEDQELSTKLNAMITEANQREAQNAQLQRLQQQKANDLLSQMK